MTNATLTKQFELNKWYRLKKPVVNKAPAPSGLVWRSHLKDGATFKCNRIFFNGRHAAFGQSVVHIGWVRGPFNSELEAKRDEVADTMRATVQPNGDGYLQLNCLHPLPPTRLDDGYIYSPYVPAANGLTSQNPCGEIALTTGDPKCNLQEVSATCREKDNGIKIMSRAWRNGTRKLVNTSAVKELVSEYDTFAGYDQGQAQFKDKHGQRKSVKDINNKEKTKMDNGTNYNGTYTTNGTNFGIGQWIDTDITKWVKTPNLVHPDYERAKGEPVVVNGQLYKDGAIVRGTDQVWFPADAFNLNEMKSDIEELVGEAKRILNEVEDALYDVQEVLDADFNKQNQLRNAANGLRDNLRQIDEKFDLDIEEVLTEHRERKEKRIEFATRVENEIREKKPTRSYGWTTLRLMAGLTTLAASAGSIYYFFIQ